MHASVIINPIAGPGRARTMDACTALARSTLASHGVTADIHVTEGPDDARRFAADAARAGADLVIAWGGDGTVNGAGAALAGTATPLAIIGGGSGNGLARDLGLPLDAAAAFHVAATGATRTIDAGELNGSLFFNVAGIGLDAGIAARMSQPGATRGLLGYLVSTVAEIRGHTPRDYSLVLTGGSGDGQTPIETAALFIALANSRQYGNGAQIAPRALLDDGILDIVVVKPLPFGALVLRVPAFFRGTLREDDRVLMRTATSARISSRGPMGFHVDGEPRVGGETLTLGTRPGILRVRVKR